VKYIIRDSNNNTIAIIFIKGLAEKIIKEHDIDRLFYDELKWTISEESDT